MVGLAHAGGQVREGGEEDHHDQEEGDAQQYGYADYGVKKGCRVKNRTQPCVRYWLLVHHDCVGHHGHHPGDQDHRALTTVDVKMCVALSLLLEPLHGHHELEADDDEGHVLQDSLVNLNDST